MDSMNGIDACHDEEWHDSMHAMTMNCMIREIMTACRGTGKKEIPSFYAGDLLESGLSMMRSS